MKRPGIKVWLTGMIICVLLSASLAYVLFGVQWPVGSNVPYYINPNTADVTDEVWAVYYAAETWSQINPAGLRLSYSGPTSETSDSLNDSNNIFWRNDGDSGSLAYARFWYWTSNNIIFETNMVFNDYYNWSTSGGYPDIETVALHEFGHWVGLDHSSSGIMTPNYDGIQRSIDSDARAGFGEMYGMQIYKLEVISGAGGTTIPSPGVYTYYGGDEVIVEAIPETYNCFYKWGEAYQGKENPIVITMNANKVIFADFRFINEPIGVSGERALNRSLSQAEYINILSWQTNPINFEITISNYKIFQVHNGKRNLIVELNANTFEYRHRNVQENTAYTYEIVAINSDGREGRPAKIVVE